MRALIPVALLFVSIAGAQIGPATFRHHYIAREMPGQNVGFGSSALADLDKDGDLDFVVSNRGDPNLYWFENRGADQWVRHLVGEVSTRQLAGLAMDVDGDGWIDIVVGGEWFRNPQSPAKQPFIRYTYDAAIKTEIHELVAADIDGDGKQDVVALGDREGCFFYKVSANPTSTHEWTRQLVTDIVLDSKVDIHSGFSPGGVGDLDGDGDADIVLPDRWLENRDRGNRWVEHRWYFGRRGPWGFSSRSVIVDLNGDGHNDVVITDSDGQNSGIALLMNNPKAPGQFFRPTYLANRAPGTRGSFHSLRVADFDGDGDMDILTVEQEDPSILPLGATPRWFIFENVGSKTAPAFEERVILDQRLGGHDVHVGDVDGDGDIDIVSKIWAVWKGNGNDGKVHVDFLENMRVRK